MKAKDLDRLESGFAKNIKAAEAGIVNMKYLLGKLPLLPNMWGIPGEYEVNSLGDFRYNLPWDDALLEKAISKARAAGWNAISPTRENLAAKTKTIVFKHPKIEDENEDLNLWFTIAAYATMPGATCKIQQIGETTTTEEVTKPIYEVVCPEADNPMMPALAEVEEAK